MTAITLKALEGNKVTHIGSQDRERDGIQWAKKEHLKSEWKTLPGFEDTKGAIYAANSYQDISDKKTFIEGYVIKTDDEIHLYRNFGPLSEAEKKDLIAAGIDPVFLNKPKEEPDTEAFLGSLKGAA